MLSVVPLVTVSTLNVLIYTALVKSSNLNMDESRLINLKIENMNFKLMSMKNSAFNFIKLQKHLFLADIIESKFNI